MEPQQFKEGDVVKLKSGGPKMTVVAALDNGRLVRCIWYEEGNGYSAEKNFLVATVEKAEEKAPQ